ncbi:DUF222 domain-containing protein [Occultella aeris]|uniref:DUF222 domain-containing protein n=1 Tax=Occultella aeris TaxID=2761496 RepID=UPI0018D37CA9|nr:DUF222 domain-containing protein [Occultella aeris]
MIDYDTLDEAALASLSPSELAEVAAFERELEYQDWFSEFVGTPEDLIGEGDLGGVVGPEESQGDGSAAPGAGPVRAPSTGSPGVFPAEVPVDLGGDGLPRVDAQALSSRPVDGFLVDELTRADLTGLDDYELVDALGCYRRLESVAAAGVREVAAELASRASMVMPRPRAVGRRVVFRESLAADEIAAKVGCSKQEANRLVRVGQFLGGIAAPTGQALLRGEIDAAKADVIAVAVSVLEAEAAFEVQDELLPKAVLWTRHRVSQEVAKLVAAADPAQFTQRAAQASTRRYVGRARIDVDGMASHTVYWPAADALGLDLLLDSAASSAKAAGDLRTLEQLRADVMADIVAHGLNTGQVGDLTGFTFQLQTGACTHDHDGHGHGAADAGADSETGTSTAGPAGGSEGTSAPRTASSGESEGTAASTTGPAGETEGTSAPSTASSGESEGTAASTTGPANEAEGTSAPVAPAGAGTGAGSQGAFLGSWHGADTGTDPRVFPPARGQGLPRVWPVGVLGGRRAQILIRVSLTTLMGGDDPGDVEGLGPIPADVARAFAAGGTWRRLVTDPISDRVLDYGTTRYEPPQNMSDRIKENEPYCTAPGCSATARMTELDHRVPFPLGPTSDDNLDPKCRRCHVLKTHGDFEDEVDEHGNRFWRTPTGHVYMRTPDGTITELPRTRPSSAGHGPTYRTAPDPDEPPPF